VKVDVPDDRPAPARLPAALDRLVDRGVLNRTQADAVLAETAGQAPPGAAHGRRRLFGEIAGYLGASFVVGATLLFLGEQWEELGRAGRFAVLAVMAVILLGSGLAVRLRRDVNGDDVRRRLSSTLFTGAAAAAAFAVFVGLDTAGDDYLAPSDRAPFVASAVGLAVVVAGYLLARTALGQLGMAVGAYSFVVTLLALTNADGPVAVGVGTLLLGVLWAGLFWRRLVAERRLGLAVAVTLGLIGAQWMLLSEHDSGDFLGYALTALVAAGCFTAYARMRDWIPLAGGVAGATLVVPEVLYDLTDGSLGPSGVMLAAGVTLLAGSLAGLRIRREPAAVTPHTP
jgi:hypothetical protein